MFIPLVDILRCVRPHEETWLVASIEHAEERYIIEGTLGCPICLAEYPIRGGVVHFTDNARHAQNISPNEVEAVRIAAALDLTEPRMTAVLHGRWGAHAQFVRGISPSQLILLNPPAGMTSGDGVSVILSDRLPAAQQSIDALALDAAMADVGAMQGSLRRGGRVLASASSPIPHGFTELARDDEVWVARLDDAAIVSAPVPLQRRGAT